MRVADYDSVPPSGYDARYRVFDFRAIEDALAGFVRGAAATWCLEAGAGTGHWLGVLAGRRIVGLDRSAGMLQRARERFATAPLVRADAAQLPFAARSFDRLFCVNALHHFCEQRQFLEEAARVLRRGGAFMSIGLDPHAGIDRWWVYDYFPEAIALDRERYPSRAVLEGHLGAAGFVRTDTTLVQHVVSTIPAEEAWRAGQLDRGFASQFLILRDEEFEQGARRLACEIERAASQGTRLMLYSDMCLYATTGWIE